MVICKVLDLSPQWLLGMMGRISGDGYADIIMKSPKERIGVVLEIKYAENEDLEKYCDETLKQIGDKNYEQALIDDGMNTIIKYGVACYKKRCKIKRG